MSIVTRKASQRRSAHLLAPSVEQGLWKPCGYTGKGLEGRGQGTEWLTPHEPLPMSMGKGIPLLLQVGKFAPVFRQSVCQQTKINSNLINVSVVFDDCSHIRHELVSLQVSFPDPWTNSYMTLC